MFGSEHDTTAALKELTSWWGTWTGDYENECPRESAVQVGVPRGMGSGKASWERGHLLRPTGGVELTRERRQNVLQAEAAECAKEEKTKHAVF